MQKISGSEFTISCYHTFLYPEGEQKVQNFLNQMKEYSPETYEHSIAVSNLAGRIGEVFGFHKEDIEKLRLAGALHDIGKLMIPLEILHKKGQLSAEEWSVMQMHVDAGYKMLLPFVMDADVLLAIRQHHERQDGSGYPDKISHGITRFAKIIMLVDVFDGMTRNRTYRTCNISIEEARRLMLEQKQRFDATYLHPFFNEVILTEISYR